MRLARDLEQLADQRASRNCWRKLSTSVVVVNRKLIAVGLPVARQTPHRSRRAVFPHRALREYSLPQQDQNDCLTEGVALELDLLARDYDLLRRRQEGWTRYLLCRFDPGDTYEPQDAKLPDFDDELVLAVEASAEVAQRYEDYGWALGCMILRHLLEMDLADCGVLVIWKRPVDVTIEPEGETYEQIAISSKGNYVAVRCGASVKDKKALCVWDVSRGTWLTKVVEHGSANIRFVFSADESSLGSFTRENEFKIFNLVDESTTIVPLKNGVVRIALDAQGQFIALVTVFNEIAIWNRKNFETLLNTAPRFLLKSEPVMVLYPTTLFPEVVFSRDGKHLLTKGYDRNKRLFYQAWELDNNELISKGCERLKRNAFVGPSQQICPNQLTRDVRKKLIAGGPVLAITCRSRAHFISSLDHSRVEKVARDLKERG